MEQDLNKVCNNRTELLRVRVKSSELALIRFFARENDTTVSDYVRRSLKHKINITTEFDDKN